ncbi:TPA: hypothetical protein ACPZAA_000115 [Yersinia enterocolitica]|nr:hypothetical protein [Yersinia ruckeri]
MNKYYETFKKVDVLMKELMDRFNIKLEEIDSYPTEDVFRIVVNKIDLENLKVLSSILSCDEILEVEKHMSPAVSKFLEWWLDNLYCDYLNIPALIASKEKEVILSSLTNVIEINVDNHKKRI